MRALELFETMQRQGVVPNTITYNALISSCENGKQLGQALEHFETMLRQRVALDAIFYSALVSACEKCKQPFGSLEKKKWKLTAP